VALCPRNHPHVLWPRQAAAGFTPREAGRPPLCLVALPVRLSRDFSAKGGGAVTAPSTRVALTDRSAPAQLTAATKRRASAPPPCDCEECTARALAHASGDNPELSAMRGLVNGVLIGALLWLVLVALVVVAFTA
jgi:hypothetical protein